MECWIVSWSSLPCPILKYFIYKNLEYANLYDAIIDQLLFYEQSASIYALLIIRYLLTYIHYICIHCTAFIKPFVIFLEEKVRILKKKKLKCNIKMCSIELYNIIVQKKTHFSYEYCVSLIILVWRRDPESHYLQIK